MSLELVNTFGTLLTVVIIAATAIAAMVQLRHLRAGNQINAMLAIGHQYVSKEFREAQDLISHKGSSALDDPLFREYNLARARRQPTPAVPDDYVQVHSAMLLVGNTHEELGILIKNGIVDKHIFLDRYWGVITEHWQRLEPFTAHSRAASADDSIWENFEYLAVLSEDFGRRHPSTYPKGMRRLQPHNAWPVPPMAATA